jgi:NAD(P)-dependent dehydrogenase (short-subunit alcohol dehydrogenase family)
MERTAPDLSGRVALVLGANHPSAAAVALAFARAGADVAVTSTTGDPEEAFALRPLRRAIESEGRRAIADIADLGNGSSVQIAVRQIAKQMARIDVAVVTSSAVADRTPERMTDAEWSRAVAYNLDAYFYACRALAKEFADNEAVEGVRGRMVAILPGVEPGPSGAVRHACRAGVRALVSALAEDWADAGIVVSALSLETAAGADGVAAEALWLAGAGIEASGRVVEIAAK